jgi:hypothetical protein
MPSLVGMHGLCIKRSYRQSANFPSRVADLLHTRPREIPEQTMENAQRHDGRASATLDEHLAHLPRVQHVMKTLVKVVGGKKLYAENNPRLAQFNEELRDALRQLFSVEDALVISIEQYRILWNDEVIYENDKRDDNLAFLLYKDGVGEVTIQKKALESEIDRFIQIITDESRRSGRDDDVVTQLWNADFDFISYRVMDDYLAGDTDVSDDPPTDVADQAELLPSLEDKGRVTVRPSDPLESIDVYLRRAIMTNCESSDDVERERASARRSARTTNSRCSPIPSSYSRCSRTTRRPCAMCRVSSSRLSTMQSANATREHSGN